MFYNTKTLKFAELSCLARWREIKIKTDREVYFEIPNRTLTKRHLFFRSILMFLDIFSSDNKLHSGFDKSKIVHWYCWKGEWNEGETYKLG